MKRRELLGALDRAVVAWPLTAHAQQPTTERMRGRVLVAGLMVLLCLMGLGFIGRTGRRVAVSLAHGDGPDCADG
jgi:hypothetical protein